MLIVEDLAFWPVVAGFRSPPGTGEPGLEVSLDALEAALAELEGVIDTCRDDRRALAAATAKLSETANELALPRLAVAAAEAAVVFSDRLPIPTGVALAPTLTVARKTIEALAVPPSQRRAPIGVV